MSAATDLEGLRARLLEQVMEVYARTLSEDELRKLWEKFAEQAQAQGAVDTAR